ncbi:MAG: hypothetical protein HKP58_18930 [Desulfatitalea sp.]|nr:hypothetical protein [Desulfatitalea sp.]NNK02490.1 hypothetical protein [Desulfatitalea sp.]
MQTRHNDNVFFEQKNPQEDFLLILYPRLFGGYTAERTSLGLSAFITHYAYKEISSEDNTDYQFKAYWRRQCNERLNFNFDVNYTDDQRIDRMLEESGLLTRDDHRRRQDYTVSGQYVLSELNSLAAYYSLNSEEYDDPDILDLVGHDFQLSLFHNLDAWFRRTTGSVRVRFSTYEYRNRQMDAGSGFAIESIGIKRFIDTYSLSLGLDRQWTEALKLNLFLGVRNTHYKNEFRFGNLFFQEVGRQEDDPWGFVGSLDLVYTGGSANAGMHLNHDLVPASGRNGLTERTSLQFSGGWRPYPAWRLSGTVTARLNRTDRTGATIDIDELTLGFAGALRYTLNRYWDLSFRLDHTEINDRERTIKRYRNAISLAFEWNLPVLE